MKLSSWLLASTFSLVCLASLDSESRTHFDTSQVGAADRTNSNPKLQDGRNSWSARPLEGSQQTESPFGGKPSRLHLQKRVLSGGVKRLKPNVPNQHTKTGGGMKSMQKYLEKQHAKADYEQTKIGLKKDQIHMDVKNQMDRKYGKGKVGFAGAEHSHKQMEELDRLESQDEKAVKKYGYTLGSKRKLEDVVHAKAGPHFHDDTTHPPQLLKTHRENPNPNQQGDPWKGSTTRDWKHRQDYQGQRFLGKSRSTQQLEADSRPHGGSAEKERALQRSHSISYPKEIPENNARSDDAMEKLSRYK